MRSRAARGLASVAALGLFVTTGVVAPVTGSPYTADAYVWPPSVSQGDTLGIYVSTNANFFNLNVQRLGVVGVPHYTEVHVPGAVQSVPDTCWAEGCGWTPSKLLPIPTYWKSGLYEVRVHPQGGSSPSTYATFVVKPRDPARSLARILYQVSITTWQAYNSWGGKSLYDYNSTDGIPSTVVSFQRPYSQNFGRGDLGYDLPLIGWLESEGYLVDYCTNLDTHADPSLQEHYSMFLSTGHDEYWSKEMRDNIEARVASGKDVSFLSGNTCWWQVRFSPELDRMFCYRTPAADPLTGIDDERVTVNWCDPPVSRPENHMTGVSSRNGGYVNWEGWYPAEEGYGGYTAYRTDHWVYAGTGLEDGEGFGQEYTVVGYEVDGAAFEWDDGLPEATGEDGTPPGFLILGVSPASNGAATMGIYTQGGTVFTAATTDWGFGLVGDPVVQRVTANVINRSVGLQVGVGDGGEGSGWGAASAPGCFPNPFRAGTTIGFEVTTGGPVELRVFDVQGKLVRTLLRGELPVGPHAVRWGGESDGGATVPAGVYYWRLEEGGRGVTRRVVRVR